MNRHLTKISLAFLALLTLAWVLIMPTSTMASTPADDIIVTGADASKDFLQVDSSRLRNAIANVLPRPVVQFSEAMREFALTNSPALRTDMANVLPRPVVQFSEAMRTFTLRGVPSALQTLLEQVADRVVIQTAEAQRAEGLSYPGGKLNDRTPPQPSIPQPSVGNGGQTVIIVWTTNEFAKSILQYGTQSGVYLQQVAVPLYAKEHSVTLTGLAVDTTYYYAITSTDREGNSATAAEASFVSQVNPVSYPLYLPLVRR